MTDKTDIRLYEIEVAIGAPMKPRRIDLGPQTVRHTQLQFVGLSTYQLDRHTQKIVQEHIDWGNNKGDAGRYREQTYKPKA